MGEPEGKKPLRRPGVHGG